MSKRRNEDNFEIVKIYSNMDERMHKLGQILSTPTSRKIYSLLIVNELNATEVGKIIGNENNLKLPNLIFHLNKMVAIGLLKTVKKSEKRGGHKLTYYMGVPLILIVPDHYHEKASKSKTLTNTFTKIFKD